MVLKDTKPNHHDWRDVMFWADYRPKEIRIHEKIDQDRASLPLDERRNLVQAIGSRVMMRSRRHRIMLRFYPGGDL